MQAMAGFGLSKCCPAVVAASDRPTRCAWTTETGRDLTVHHDSFWVTPTHDRTALFRELVVTYFENGLSWPLIHAKRDAFDASFAGFDPIVAAGFSPAKVESLLGNRSIVRSPSKIEATFCNAHVVVTDDRFVDRVWDHEPVAHYRLRTRADGLMDSPDSQSLAKEMRSRGYRFVGPVVAHSFMQTVGVENGHFDGCFRAPLTDREGTDERECVAEGPGQAAGHRAPWPAVRHPGARATARRHDRDRGIPAADANRPRRRRRIRLHLRMQVGNPRLSRPSRLHSREHPVSRAGQPQAERLISELAWATLRDLGVLIKSKEISSRELVAEHLDNVEAMNPAVNAIVTLDVERSLAEAAYADELLASGTHFGPLHGIPAAFNDTHETASMRTTFGSPLYKHHVSDHDDITVARMRSAGAITIGKTNVPEFATGCNTFNPLSGATRNPYSLDRAAGGSSGGSAARLITGMAATCEGSDLGVSRRNPASFCNMVGLRPAPGRAPDAPAQFAWPTLHMRGSLGRPVDDLAILLSVISGPDARNLFSVYADGSAFPNIAPADLRGLRVAWAPILGGIVDVDDAVLETLRPQLATFESFGCILEEGSIDFDGADASFRTQRAWTFAYTLNDLNRQHRDQLGPSLVWSIEEGHFLSGRDIGAAIESHALVYQNAREFFETYDVLLTPAAQVVPFDIDPEYPMVIAGNSSSIPAWDLPTPPNVPQTVIGERPGGHTRRSRRPCCGAPCSRPRNRSTIKNEHCSLLSRSRRPHEA